MKFTGLLKVLTVSVLTWTMSSSAQAGGAFETTIGGIPVTWGGEAFWNADPGPLVPPAGTPEPDTSATTETGTGTASDSGGGCSLFIPQAKADEIPNAEAVAMIQEAFNTWTSVSDTNLKVTQEADLPEEVTVLNIENYFAAQYNLGGQVVPHQVDTQACYDNNPDTPCRRPVIWDRFGIITETIFGACSYNTQFAYASVIPNVDNDTQSTINDQNSQLAAAQMVVSGACLGDGVQRGGCAPCSGADLDFVKGVVTHEVGHFLGLDHTVNMEGDDYETCAFLEQCGEEKLKTVPTMIATLVPGADLKTLHEDDKSAFRRLYPSADMESKYCEITGVARTEVLSQLGRGLEVVAVKLENNQENWEKAVSTVAGSIGTARKFQGVEGLVGEEGKNRENCEGWPNNEDCGRFSMFVEPGTYRMVVRPFNSSDGMNFLGVDIEPLAPTLFTVLPPEVDTNINNLQAPSNIVANNNAGTVNCGAGQTKTIDVKSK